VKKKKKITALYDGSAIYPDEPLPLPRDTRLVITWEADDPQPDPNDDVGATTFFDVARSLEICGPPDWSERVDYYMGHDMSGYSDNPDLRQDDLENEHG
jgi:hypothetical protein